MFEFPVPPAFLNELIPTLAETEKVCPNTAEER